MTNSKRRREQKARDDSARLGIGHDKAMLDKALAHILHHPYANTNRETRRHGRSNHR